MPKSPAERKAAQRARQAAAGGKKLELALDSQELEMLAHNCAARRPGREPYELNEYIALLIRKDAAAAGAATGGAGKTPVREVWRSPAGTVMPLPG